MHSTLTRLQNIFGFFTSVAFFISALTAVSVLLIPQTPSADISLRSIQVVKGRPHYYSSKREEYAHIKFDLDADLSSLFNWNTKQVFLYVIATWPPTQKSDGSIAVRNSSAVVWDSIVPAAPSPSRDYLAQLIQTYAPRQLKPKKTSSSKKKGKGKGKGDKKLSPGVIKLSNQRGKYQITDISGHLAGVSNATLEVGYNVQPWVGALLWKDTGRIGPSEVIQNRPSSSIVRDILDQLEEFSVAFVRSLGKWKPLKNGKTNVWDFPPLKGSKSTTSQS